ncbi:msl3 [Symbiodinium natans]|uniref:Msl3 protein n=1 Tax=Symbiodinium natans TaxID=878477 RepID=A0A812TJL7_9DINO|nr:msl3 [Symbiodinium natans]
MQRQEGSQATSADDAARWLQFSGYCVLPARVPASRLAQAHETASTEEFELPSEIVAQGLLGPDFGVGVEFPTGASQAATQFPLWDLARDLLDLSACVAQHMASVFEFCAQTPVILHRRCELEGEEASLSEIDASRWLDVFRRHRLLSIFYLGPQSGVLDLWTFQGGSPKHPMQVQLEAGHALVLRPELLARQLHAPAGSLVMTCFALGRRPSARRVWPGQGHSPAACALDEWTRCRLQKLSEEDCVGLDIPFSWRKDLRRSYDNGLMVAVNCAAGRFPRADTLDAWCRTAGVAAADFATEVPFQRWDHSEVYDPDPNSQKRGTSCCRHAAFIDGLDLFASSTFSMLPEETQHLDPYQRLGLEAAFSILHSAGVNGGNPIRNQRSSGLYVACPSGADWEHGPKAKPISAQEALASRMSMMLGLRGPSSLVCLESASGLAAASLAAEALQACDSALALGVHLCLSPRMWSRYGVSTPLSRSGRCFAFDASSDGFVRGEGCCALMLSRFKLPDPTETASPPAGCIVGSAVSSKGSSADLAAPARADAIRRTVFEAMSGLEADFVDIAEVDGLGPAAEMLEMTTLRVTHRGQGTQAGPLQLTSLKASCGHQVQCAGLACVMQLLAAIRLGTTAAQPHLRQLNPQCLHNATESHSGVEPGQLTEPNLYAGVLGRGGGSIAYAVLWGFGGPMAQEDPAVLKPELLSAMEDGKGRNSPLAEVPGEGPTPKYCLIGSWDNWTRLQAMWCDADGWHGWLRLGPEGEESFQILKEGDPNQALFPNCRNARPGRPHPRGSRPQPAPALLAGRQGGRGLCGL